MLVNLGNGNYCSQSDYCDFPTIGFEIESLSDYEESPYSDYLRIPDEIDY